MKNQELLEKIVKHINDNYDITGCMPTTWAVCEMAARVIGRDISPAMPWQTVRRGLRQVAKNHGLKI
jgi:hypothetical protein